jgi:hypothetical protein
VARFRAVVRGMDAYRGAKLLTALFGTVAVFVMPVSAADGDATMATPETPPTTTPAPAGSRTLRITPIFTVEQTFTDNVALSATDTKSDSITRLSPGISLDSRSGRVVGLLSYSADVLVYARENDKNTIQNSLSANLSSDLVDDHVRLDVRASVSQQSLSAFGVRTGSSTLVNDNSTEVATLTLSPSVRSRFGANGNASARLTWSRTNASSTDEGDLQTLIADASAGSRYEWIDWTFDASRVVDDFGGVDDTTRDDVLATLGATPHSALRFSLRTGWKSDDIVDAGLQSGSFWGVGIDWSPHDTVKLGYAIDDTYFGRAQSIDLGFFPTPRTNLTLTGSEEVYGNTYSLRFSHRMARSTWTYSDIQGLSGGDLLDPNAQQLVDNYRRAYDECLRSIRDAALCDQLARLVVGLDPKGTGGFLNSQSSVDRAKVASVSYAGIRTTVTLAGSYSENRRIAGVSYAVGDLSTTDRVRETGWSVGLSHRLTPISTLALRTSLQRTLDSGPLLGNELRESAIVYSATLGVRTTGNIELRHTEFDSPNNPYNETALTGSLSFRF